MIVFSSFCLDIRRSLFGCVRARLRFPRPQTAKKVLEINPAHPLIRGMLKIVKVGARRVRGSARIEMRAGVGEGEEFAQPCGRRAGTRGGEKSAQIIFEEG